LLCNEPEFLQGALIADKVVGKAAAALMILGEVKDLYADVISQQALSLLKQTDMHIEYGQSVPYIVNRTQTDWCPMEKLCFTEDSPEKIRVIICDFLNSMNVM
jgi:iron complex outermembrane receptor protein